MESKMTRFTIPDMDCEGCVASITKAVHRIDASATVQADLKTKLVEIQSAEGDQALKSAIDDAGYTVQAA
jgi:copper chaperone